MSCFSRDVKVGWFPGLVIASVAQWIVLVSTVESVLILPTFPCLAARNKFQ